MNFLVSNWILIGTMLPLSPFKISLHSHKFSTLLFFFQLTSALKFLLVVSCSLCNPVDGQLKEGSSLVTSS